MTSPTILRQVLLGLMAPTGSVSGLLIRLREQGFDVDLPQIRDALRALGVQRLGDTYVRGSK